MEQEPIVARAIIQVVGAPKEYIESTLKSFVERQESDGLKVRSKEFSEATKQGDFFSTFVEMVAEFKSVDSLVAFCFDAMPSSIEILEPPMLTIKAFDFSNSLNDLQSRLHEVEMTVKRLKGANELLDTNALELIRNFISFALKDKRMRLEEIAPIVGVNPKDLQPFLDKMVEENRLSVEEGNYFIG